MKPGNQVRENPADTGELSIFLEKDLACSELLSDLEDLHSRATIRNPYFSSEWLKSWLSRQSDEICPLLLLARTEKDGLTGFGPLSSARVCSGPKDFGPSCTTRPIISILLATGKGARALVRAMKTQLKHFLFCWVPLMRDSFWQEILEPETQRGKFLTLTRMPRKTALIEPPVDDLSFEDFLGERLGAKSRKSLRYDQRKLAEQGEVAIETVDSLKEVRAIMPATCLVEVESWKSKEGAGLYSIRGKRGFFLSYFPNWPSRAGPGSRSCVWTTNPSLGKSTCLMQAMSAFIIWPSTKPMQNFHPASSY